MFSNEIFDIPIIYRYSSCSFLSIVLYNHFSLRRLTFYLPSCRVLPAAAEAESAADQGFEIMQANVSRHLSYYTW